METSSVGLRRELCCFALAASRHRLLRAPQTLLFSPPQAEILLADCDGAVVSLRVAFQNVVFSGS